MEIQSAKGHDFPQPVSLLLEKLPAPPTDAASVLVVSFDRSIAHTPTSFERIDAEQHSLVDLRA